MCGRPDASSPEHSLEPLLYSVNGLTPNVADSAFLAPGVVLIGGVTLGEGTSIWYGSVLRADSATITVGRDVNLQDGSLLHCDAEFPVVLGDRVSLGHGAIVHGATVDDDVLIGIRATVLNGAHIGAGSLIAAGALVLPGTVIPPGSMVVGSPAAVKRAALDRDAELIARTATNYLRHGAAHAAALAERRQQQGD